MNDAQIFIPELGGIYSFGRDFGRREGLAKFGAVLVDIISNRHAILRNRDEIAASGFVIASLVVDHETRQLVVGPKLTGQGLDGHIDDRVLRRAEEELEKFLQRRQKGGFSTGYLVSRTKGVLSRQIYRQTKIHPLILPVVTEL
jgi:ribonuclease J